MAKDGACDKIQSVYEMGADLMLDKSELKKNLTELFEECGGNTVPADIALPGCAGLVLLDEPLIGVSSAADGLYKVFKKKEVVGDHFLLPAEWLPEAETVISFFFPFTERVRRSNRGKPEATSPEWLHARIEGQAFITAFTEKLKEYFDDRGIKTCVPATDKRFAMHFDALPEGDPKGMHMTSNWSERHAAYASGLGTFCLTRGLISSKGVAGRYASIIISEYVEPDERAYDGIYDYCIMCGACIKRCPAAAISLDGGKNQILCKAWNDRSKEIYKPRFGCGKCQVGVPCEDRIPKAVRPVNRSCK